MFSSYRTKNKTENTLRSRKNLAFRERLLGASILEILVSMTILSLATITLLKATSNALASSTENRERHQLTLLGTDLLNVLAAHVAPMDLQSSESKIRTRVENVSKLIEKESNLIMKSKGYQCNRGTIKQIPPSGDASDNKATLLKNWGNGSPTCVFFTIVRQPSTANGVWVQAHLSRLSVTQQNAGAESIVITSLIAPF